jgi:hypothetical protein
LDSEVQIIVPFDLTTCIRTINVNIPHECTLSSNWIIS